MRFDDNHVEVHTLERELDRKEARRQMHVRRRRYLLWTPLAIVGAALIAWQTSQAWPIPILTYIGAVMCVPLVVDV